MNIPNLGRGYLDRTLGEQPGRASNIRLDMSYVIHKGFQTVRTRPSNEGFSIFWLTSSL